MASIISRYPFLEKILDLKSSELLDVSEATLDEQVLQSPASWAGSISAGGADYDEFSTVSTFAIKGSAVAKLVEGTVRDAIAQLSFEPDYIVKVTEDTWERDTWPEISTRHYEYRVRVYKV
jgi:hypothetical protein